MESVDLLPRDDFGPPFGWALRRNNTCLKNESACGHTWDNWIACCPQGAMCPSGTDAARYNAMCCPSDADCHNAFNSTKTAHCANDEAEMFNDAGYFCCPKGMTGWALLDYGFVGCTEGAPKGESDATILTTISQAHVGPTATSTSPPKTTTDTSSSSSGGGTNVGAIAGGTVGGVVGLALIGLGIFFLLRRRRGGGAQHDYAAAQQAELGEDKGQAKSPNGASSELEGYYAPPAQEVDSHSQRFEMPAS